MSGTTTVALISIVASAVVALASVIVPQILAARERRVAHFLAHEVWWRDTRAPLYSEVLSFCIRAEQENEPSAARPLVTELAGRVNALGSPEVSTQFQLFLSALEDQDREKASTEHGTLRGLLSEGLWNLSRGFH